MDAGIIALVVTAVVGVVVAVVGIVKWGSWHTKAEQIADLLTTVVKAAADKMFTQEEISDIIHKVNVILGKE